MAAFRYTIRGLITRSQRLIHLTPSQKKWGEKKLPDPWDLMTGVELWEALQHKKGNYDPFLTLPQKRGPGTKDCPNVVYAFQNYRIVGCICDSESHSIKWMVLHEGYPRRCYCNHWFVLERIPIPEIYGDD